MAVYTDVSVEDLDAFLKPYDVGGLVSFRGIAEGVENSNYVLEAEKGRFILTLYEKRVNEADLPFFLGLMEHLQRQGINCPQPVRGSCCSTHQASRVETPVSTPSPTVFC